MFHNLQIQICPVFWKSSTEMVFCIKQKMKCENANGVCVYSISKLTDCEAALAAALCFMTD